MSGGHFNYEQYRISLIADEIERLIDKNGSSETNEWGERRYASYTPETIGAFRDGVTALRRAYIYAHEIDYLICGDTGEESFRARLRKELEDTKGESKC